MDDDKARFTDNLVVGFERFDARNLFFCRFLNLRHSAINFVDTTYLFSLEHIDIAFSRIKNISLGDCVNLGVLISDNSQTSITSEDVHVVIIYGTAKWLGKSKISLGSATKIKLQDQEL